MVRAGSNGGLGGLVVPSAPVPLAWWSAWLVLLMAAAAQRRPQTDGQQGIPTLIPNGNFSEVAWEEAQDYRGTLQAGLGSRALTASAHHLHPAGAASPRPCHRLGAVAMSGV